MSLSDLNGSSHCGADEMFISLLSCILFVEVDCLLISLFESAFAFKKCVALNSLTVFSVADMMHCLTLNVLLIV